MALSPGRWLLCGQGVVIVERILVVALAVASTLAAGLAVGALVAWTSVSERQLAHWRDTRTLFEHALAADPTNAMAHASLGRVAEREGRPAEALAHYDEAFSLAPDFGNLLEDRARVQRALDHEVRAEHERGPAE